MARPVRRPNRRQIVTYTLYQDELGVYITFTLSMTILPSELAPHRLPAGARLRQEAVSWRFMPSRPGLSARDLLLLFLEFAKTMHWEARQQDP